MSVVIREWQALSSTGGELLSGSIVFVRRGVIFERERCCQGASLLRGGAFVKGVRHCCQGGASRGTGRSK